jgi:hypothetical protein
VASKNWERRPQDEEYYAQRTDYVRQGDIFRDIPLGYPMPPEAVDHSEGKRKFISGPFEPGFGMLLSPTCVMRAQGASGYAHPVRMLAPVLSLEHLLEKKVIKQAGLENLRAYDHLISYFYLPPLPEQEFPESLALLYAAITIHHDYLEERRVAQLSETGSIHLKYKLSALFGGTRFAHRYFSDVAG